MAYELRCSNCGKKLLRYEQNERKYKSPVAACKKCGHEYIDPRCQEIAVIGIPDAEFHISRRVLLLVIGGLIAWRGWRLLGMRQLGVASSMQWLLPAAIFLLGAAFILGAVIDSISILTGRKRKKFERLSAESAERMSNPAYVEKLKRMGYITGDSDEE